MTNLFVRLLLSVLAALVGILFWHCTSAQAADPSDDIDTNRPSFMFSPIVLPKGSLQLENGCLDSGLRRGRLGFDLPETQVRIGLARSTEFQVFVPNFVLNKSGGDFSSGVTDLSEIGIKQQLPTPGKFKAAIIASVTAPTGTARLSRGGTSGILRLPYLYAINNRWSIGGMQSLLIINYGNSVQWQPDVLVSRSIGKKLVPSLSMVAILQPIGFLLTLFIWVLPIRSVAVSRLILIAALDSIRLHHLPSLAADIHLESIRVDGFFTAASAVVHL